jgi:hypothetical protein
MHASRRSGVVLLLSVVAALLGPVGAPAHGAATPEPVTVFSFTGTCDGVPGQIHVRERRFDERHALVSTKATGLPDRLWYGDLAVGTRRGTSVATFRQRSTDGIVQHSDMFTLPVTGSDISATVRDYETDDECGIGAFRREGWVEVGADTFHLRVTAFEGDLTVEARDYECRNGATWRVRATVMLPGRTLHEPLGVTECRRHSFSAARLLDGHVLSRRVEVVARDDDGHVQRVSYRIARP